jgi:hypothetical protein
MSSSRRTTGDINILAMLDGQAPGRRLRVLPAALRYGAAGVLACSLLATLVWLVQDDAPARDAGKGAAAQASLQPGAAGPAARPADATTLRDTQPAGAHAVELIVTQRDDLLTSRDGMPASVPGTGTAPAAEPSVPMAAAPVSTRAPLRMPPTAAASARTAALPGVPAPAATRGAVIVDMPPPASAAPPAPTVATTISAPPAHAAPGMAAVQVQPAADGHALSRTTGRTTAQATPARTPPGPQAAPARAPSLARTGTPTSHQKRGAAASRTAPPSVVDRDVAVISAILQHTAARGETADAAPVAPCPDKSCATRMPSRQ